MRAEHEVHRAEQAQRRPQEVQPERLLHVEEGEGDEDGEGGGTSALIVRPIMTETLAGPAPY